jgi:hypothetical protein
VKFAYIDDWLRSLFTSNGALQLACGHSWETVALLMQLAGSVTHLSALHQLPGVQVVAVTLAGAAGYMVFRCQEVELRVYPIDHRGRQVKVTSNQEVWSLSKVLVFEVLIRGKTVAQPQAVTA